LPDPLNANELLQRAGFQDFMFRAPNFSRRYAKMPLMLKQSQTKMERLKKRQHVECNRILWMVSWWIYVADVELTIFN